jgi:peptidoglycan/xylan/chitin deacetylase (PgdA/CDA1 family)
LTLIYHRVRRERDPMFPGEVTAVEFEWQMALLRRYCNPIPLADAVALLKNRELPPRAVAVTFDDGYRDNATIALPILSRHGVPATFFVATSFLDGGIMWNDAVVESIRNCAASNVDFSDLGARDTTLASFADRGRIAGELIGRIKHLPSDERARCVNAITERCKSQLPRDLMMSTDEVRQLHGAGMEVGAHTVNHPILMTLAAHAASEEIAGSRAALQAIINAPVTAFAYPNGRPGEDYGPRERELVEKLGFQYAAATRWGVAAPGTDIFQLPRFTPWDKEPARWLARLLLQFRQPV